MHDDAYIGGRSENNIKCYYTKTMRRYDLEADVYEWLEF